MSKNIEEIKEENFLIPREFFRDAPYKSMNFKNKILYGILLSFADEKGYIYITLNELSAFMSTKSNSVSKMLDDLSSFNLIKELSPIENKELVSSKNLTGYGFGNKTCAWCNIKTLYLQEHHYPIPRSQGGTEVVSICPTCHVEFHAKIFKLNTELDFCAAYLRGDLYNE